MGFREHRRPRRWRNGLPAGAAMLALAVTSTAQAAGQAAARYWTVLSGLDNECHPASALFHAPGGPSPVNIHELLQHAGVSNTLQETEVGSNVFVTLTVDIGHGVTTTMVFASSPSACAALRTGLIADGKIPNPSDVH
jgi:hypothetical protein